MAQSMALASLTETYTDSEGEDEIHDDENENTGSVTINTPNTTPDKSTPSSQPPTPAKITTKLTKLVSYLDETVLSDDENGDESTTTIVFMETETQAPETEPVVEGGIQLPLEPQGKCSEVLQNKILRLYDKMQNSDLDMNALIHQRKDFRNPSIYEKLIQYCSINELGTNYPPAIYDPAKWNKESYYEELAKVQKIEMDRREKERKSNKVEFVSGTKKHDEDAKKRKSKWDQPGGNSGNAPIKPAGLVQPSLTSSATGTKATVISAFGSLPKKPRP